MSVTRDVIAAYWAAAERRDWQAFASLLAEDVVYEAPQTRERVVGKAAYLRFNVEGFPGAWHVAVDRIVGDAERAASLIVLTYEDGTAQHGICFFDVDAAGLVARITDFWPDPYEPPAGRAHLVTRT